MTLTKINTKIGYSTSTDTLNKLCDFFNCEISELVEYVSDDKLPKKNGKEEQN